MASSGVASASLIDRDSLLETSLLWWKNHFDQTILSAARKGDLEVFFSITFSNGWREIIKLLIRMAKENRLGFIRVTNPESGPRKLECFPHDYFNLLPEEHTFDDFKLYESDKSIRIGLTWGS